MRRTAFSITGIAAALAAALLLSTSAIAAPKSAKADKADVLVTVNGVGVPKSMADSFVAEQAAQNVPDTPELREQVKEELVRREVLSQEAKRLGLDKKREVTAQMELARQAVLIRTLIQEQMKANPVTDAEMQKEYDTVKAQLSGTEYKSRHILVEQEDEAKAIIDKIGKGAKFEELAKQSKDPGSKDNGGDLGWSPANAFVKPFAEALAKLEKGKMTAAPVKTDFGYHVIQLEDTRPLAPPPFEQLKPRIQQHLQQQRVEKLVGDLRAKAKVE